MHTLLPVAEEDRAERDRALFDRIAREYCRKDLALASRVARRQRLMRTLVSVPWIGTQRCWKQDVARASR